MITAKQRDAFRLMLAAVNYPSGTIDALDVDDVCTDADIVETADTVEVFLSLYGKSVTTRGRAVEQLQAIFGNLFVWDKVQTRKGCRRGTLYVVDFGDVRAVYFDGEA